MMLIKASFMMHLPKWLISLYSWLRNPIQAQFKRLENPRHCWHQFKLNSS
jgi:hypothetical protein